MTFSRRALGVAIACTSLGIASRAQTITDLLAPLTLLSGQSDTVLVSDLFYADSYPIVFRTNKDVRISYDARLQQAVFQSRRGFVGATVVDFDLAGARYAFPLFVTKQRSHRIAHTFRYDAGRYAAGRGVKSVAVTGTFNNWNPSSDVMTGPSGRNIFTRVVQLDPGTFLYKFVVDGKEIVDPGNPERSPTGFDDFNSVLRIVDPDTTSFSLHIAGSARTSNDLRISFMCEQPWGRNALSERDVIALDNNARIGADRIGVKGYEITVLLPLRQLSGTHVVRVLVSRHERMTNLQQIVLRDGTPAGKEGSASWSDGVIYSILVDRFRDGDTANDVPVKNDSLFTQANYQGGDLRGISEKINDGYFDSLGVNILWISPVYDNPDIAFRESPPPHRWYSGYHGYWPISDTLVEEKFGTMDDLKDLVTKAHAHHIRVLLDFVAHHVHIDHPFYKNHPEWFGTLDLPDGRKNLRLWDEFRLSTWFEPYMPSFDFTKSAKAADVVASNAIWWLKTTGADGFRHDAVKHVPNSFWRELTRRIKEQIEVPAHRMVYQIGETFGDDALISSYVNNGQLSAQFNFNLSYLAIPIFLDPEKSFATLDTYVRRSFNVFGPYNLMGNIMDSHDKVRYMAYADGKVKSQGTDTREMAWTNPPTVDHPSSYRKAELYLAYMLTTPGIPVIYYGSEFGMTGADDPDNRRMMRFGPALTEQERAMLGVTRSLVRLRDAHPALRYGDFHTLVASDHVYAYLRSDLNERVVIVLNKSADTVSVSLAFPVVTNGRKLVDLQGDIEVPIVRRTARVDVPGIGFRVFKLE